MSYYIKNVSSFDEVALKTGKAHMLLPERDLEFLIKLIKLLVPKGQKGLEIGTFIGKTTAAFATCGYPMVTIEHNQDYIIEATKSFDELGLSQQVLLLKGRAEEVLVQQDEYFWDSIKFAFVDANKGGYYNYFKLLTSSKRMSQGYLIFDNIFLNNQIKEEVHSLFDKRECNLLGIQSIFGVSVSSLQGLLTESVATKNLGPSWSTSVKEQMLRLCREAKDQYQAVLLDTSDGMLLLSKQ